MTDVPGSAYHHGHLREALVAEAISAVRTEGPDGLALRELARRVGVSHNAAYRHFAQRSDLVAEVAAHAMRALVEAMRERLEEVDGVEPVLRARRRLAGIGRAYVEFAVAEPGLFRVAFTHVAGSSARDLVEVSPYAQLGDALDGLVDVGFLSAQERVGAEITCWSAVHGFAVLTLDGPRATATDGAPELGDGARRDLDRLLVAIDRSYAATTGSDADPVALLAGPREP